jgi:outer membrane protein OmpA-like peptidoglycan-associated protein
MVAFWPPPPPPAANKGRVLILTFFTYSFFSFLSSAHAQETRWYDPFFIEGSAIHYYLPELFSGIMKPQPGFRGALGYEYRHFRLALESGYTRIEGTNPLVLETTLAPLSAKLGYNLPLRWGLGLQADISFGFFFSRTLYYKSAVDMMMDKAQDEPVASPVAGARLYAVYTFPFEWLKLYAGGGVDMVLETDGPIPPPVIEAGISIKPFVLLRRKERKAEAAKTEPVETEAAAREIPQAEAPAAKRPRGIVLSQRAVYFWADSAVIIEEYKPVLDDAGQRLRANPALRVTLKGYTAPWGTEEGMTALSAARAWYCVEYLMRVYGIAEDRMNIEFYGADKGGADEPAEQKSREYRRRVDIFIEREAE